MHVRDPPGLATARRQWCAGGDGDGRPREDVLGAFNINIRPTAYFLRRKAGYAGLLDPRRQALLRRVTLVQAVARRSDKPSRGPTSPVDRGPRGRPRLAAVEPGLRLVSPR